MAQRLTGRSVESLSKSTVLSMPVSLLAVAAAIFLPAITLWIPGPIYG